MKLLRQLRLNAKKKQRNFIFPESGDERIIRASKEIIKRKLGKVTLVTHAADSIDLKPDKSLTIIDTRFSEQFLEKYSTLRRKKSNELNLDDLKIELSDPLTFGCMLLKSNYADGLIAGAVYPTSDVLRNGIRIIGLSNGNKTASSFFLFNFPAKHKCHDRIIAYADCGVIPFPDSKQLSDIAISTAKNYYRLTGKKPRVAFLSFSTKGSAYHERLETIFEAIKLTRRRAKSLVVDGELQFDAAFVPEVATRKNSSGKIKGDANVFIFPDLNSGNIAYKITERIGGAIATGPIVQGLAKPIMDLSRGCSSDDIVNMFIIASNLS